MVRHCHWPLALFACYGFDFIKQIHCFLVEYKSNLFLATQFDILVMLRYRDKIKSAKCYLSDIIFSNK